MTHVGVCIHSEHAIPPACRTCTFCRGSSRPQTVCAQLLFMKQACLSLCVCARSCVFLCLCLRIFACVLVCLSASVFRSYLRVFTSVCMFCSSCQHVLRERELQAELMPRSQEVGGGSTEAPNGERPGRVQGVTQPCSRRLQLWQGL